MTCIHLLFFYRSPPGDLPIPIIFRGQGALERCSVRVAASPNDSGDSIPVLGAHDEGESRWSGTWP